MGCVCLCMGCVYMCVSANLCVLTISLLLVSKVYGERNSRAVGKFQGLKFHALMLALFINI